MAKKQQIILLHGTTQATSNEQLNLVQGEIAVRNATSKEESEIYSLTSDDKLVAFPSKEYVAKAISDLNYGSTIESINTKIAALETADANIRKDFAAADANITTAYTAADTAVMKTLRSEFEGADSAITADIEGINTEIEGINTEIEGLKTADANIISAYTAADAAIETAYKKADADIISAYTAADAAIETAYKAADEALQSAVNSKVAQSVYDAKVAEIKGDIDTLESVLSGYSGEGSVKTAVDSKVAQSDYDTKVAEIKSDIEAINTALDDLDGDFATNDELASAVSTLEGKITAAENNAKTLVETGENGGVKVTEVTTEGGIRTYKVEGVDLATDTNLTALKGRVDVLTTSGVDGVDDSNKSVRTIAIEVLTDTLVAEGAAEAYDTLAEMAAWIQSHPEDAAAMNEAIQKNATDITAEANRATKAEEALDGRITAEVNRATSAETALTTAINNETNRATSAETALETRVKAIEDDYLVEADKTELNNLITGLDTRVGTNETNITNLTKTVNDNKTELEGKITAKTVVVEENSDFIIVTPATSTTNGTTYTITTTDIASANALTALDTRVQTAEGSITDLLTFKNTTVPETYETKTNVANAISGVSATVSANKTELEGKITAETNRATGVESGLDSRLQTLETNHIKNIVVTNASNHGITTSTENNVFTLNLDAMVIDGGTY